MLKQVTQQEYEKKQKDKIEKELPYFITFVTLLATSGFGPYMIFQRLKDIDLLPTIKIEAEKILKRVDLLGMDPLSAMLEAKNKPASKALGEFLSGYVSSIQSGGNVAGYLKSKMETTFERLEEIEKESVNKVKTLVEAYMTIQIVILAVYIIITAMQSTEDSSPSLGLSENMRFVAPPLVSVGFMVLGHKIQKAKVHEIPLKPLLLMGAPIVSVATIVTFLGIAAPYGPILIGLSLIGISIWPTLYFKKIYKLGIDAENSTPIILRDIAEARKAGLGPEKCVIKACSREDFGVFNFVANSIANKLKWGVPFENLYSWLKEKISNFNVLVNFKILFEIIHAGGGNTNTLDSLASISEKIHNVEKNKIELLKPYIIVGFMLMGMTSFTTLLVIDSLTSISIGTEIDEQRLLEIESQSEKEFEFFSYAVVAQAWLAGLFLGKITTGSYSNGFKLSIFLVMITMITITLIQTSVFDINSFF